MQRARKWPRVGGLKPLRLYRGIEPAPQFADGILRLTVRVAVELGITQIDLQECQRRSRPPRASRHHGVAPHHFPQCVQWIGMCRGDLRELRGRGVMAAIAARIDAALATGKCDALFVLPEKK